MLTTAACPEASRNRRTSSAIIQHPSPRVAMGKVFLKWRGKRPPLGGMRCPGKECSRDAKGVSALGTKLSYGGARHPLNPRTIRSAPQKHDIPRAAQTAPTL